MRLFTRIKEIILHAYYHSEYPYTRGLQWPSTTSKVKSRAINSLRCWVSWWSALISQHFSKLRVKSTETLSSARTHLVWVMSVYTINVLHAYRMILLRLLQTNVSCITYLYYYFQFIYINHTVLNVQCQTGKTANARLAGHRIFRAELSKIILDYVNQWVLFAFDPSLH